MLNIFVININAGKNNSSIIEKIITDYCNSKNTKFKIEYVYEINDTQKIVDKYKKFNDVNIYSVGGDGTLNQIINCIANTDLKLNIIPAGTGNDFYKSLIDYESDKIDLGKVNDKYFVNVASFGLDAKIAATANEYKNKNMNKELAYYLGIIKEFFPYQALNVNVNDIEKLITIVTICNGKYYGGGFNIAPNAILNDGLFDIYEVEKINKFDILKLILKLKNGKHGDDKNVKFYRSNNLKIESDLDLICNLDGEIITGKSFDFIVEKDAITLGKDEIKIKELLKSKKIIK